MIYTMHMGSISGITIGRRRGNAYTGASSSASGGDVFNFSEDDASELMNTGGSK